MKRVNFQDAVISQLVTILRNVVEEGTEDAADGRKFDYIGERNRRKGPSDARNGKWGMSLEDQKEKENILAAYTQQAYAAKLIGLRCFDPVSLLSLPQNWLKRL